MDFYNEMKVNGFYHFNDPNAFVYLKWYFKMPMFKYQTVQYPILLPLGKLLLRKSQKLINKLYLDNFNAEFGNVNGWRGIDSNTDVWHNDLIEGWNTAFLLYMSEITEETGGGIQFKRIDSDEVYTIYPKKYDIIIMDQSETFLHRVIPLSKPINRNVVNIEFNI